MAAYPSIAELMQLLAADFSWAKKFECSLLHVHELAITRGARLTSLATRRHVAKAR